MKKTLGINLHSKLHFSQAGIKIIALYDGLPMPLKEKFLFLRTVITNSNSLCEEYLSSKSRGIDNTQARIWTGGLKYFSQYLWYIPP